LVPLPVVRGKRIIIGLEDQTLQAIEKGELKWEWPISSGLPSSPTSVGVFQVQKHEENAFAAIWDLYMPKFLAIYEPIPESDFFNGIHGFPWRGEQQLLWVNQLGQPATFGCVMISTENAELLFDWADDGTIVHIQP
jgi:lipoprotein-anchoring transpeptidase ErfK/SrfK